MSAIFKKIYEEEFGQLGGKPFGMLVGDYEFGRGPGRYQPAQAHERDRGSVARAVRGGGLGKDVRP